MGKTVAKAGWTGQDERQDALRAVRRQPRTARRGRLQGRMHRRKTDRSRGEELNRSCMPSPARSHSRGTPNLDRLAETSVRFNNFMVNSVCAPSRGSLLTGRDFWRTGCEGLHGGKEFLHLDERTFGNVFQDAAYATGMWGKCTTAGPMATGPFHRLFSPWRSSCN